MSKQQVEKSTTDHAVQNIPGKPLADFLTQDEAAAELKICERTLDRWRRLGEGPPVTKLGRRVLYRRSSLQAWLRACEHRGDAA
jgi:predicted DNA-binding transcriptional regulator AlpA